MNLPDTPWPASGPDFNRWNLDAAALLRIIQAHPMLWCQDHKLKYLTFVVDTRDGGFLLKDQDGNPVSPDEVVAAARAAGTANPYRRRPGEAMRQPT